MAAANEASATDAGISRDQAAADLESGVGGQQLMMPGAPRAASVTASVGSATKGSTAPAARKSWFGGGASAAHPADEEAVKAAKTAGWFKQCRYGCCGIEVFLTYPQALLLHERLFVDRLHHAHESSQNTNSGEIQDRAVLCCVLCAVQGPAVA